jgi:undecaprenyl-diphosphatase
MLAVLGLVLGPPWFGLVLLTWAPLVSLARVVVGVHYLSDIVAGLVVGALAGLVMASIYPLLIKVFPIIF